MQTSGEELINHGLDCEQCGFKDKLDTNMKSHMIHQFKLLNVCEVTFSGLEELSKHIDCDHLC